ncbi:MAG TPA: SGNH/GDSL hydrolase family protein [Longimicrobium sp.]|jgi:lysophospholipase L1-like esterase|uniref:SGNH/GDSL hydrolase family protein n=1 Tax=Longimicrobium sp. TaxID=2029185 RepID=UPI002EDA7A79
MPHVILLGDSIFDNAAYVRGGPDVIAQLNDILPGGWTGTLAAIDGATTSDMPIQYRRITKDATHLVLSIGGNDALMNIDILNRRASSVAEVLNLLADMRDRFEAAYREVVAELRGRGLPLVICTIYNGNFPDAAMQRVAQTALSMFNDAILRVGIESGLPIIDLRLVCNDPGDYANPIEPSVQGGAKMARAIVRVLAGEAPEAVVFAG